MIAVPDGVRGVSPAAVVSWLQVLFRRLILDVRVLKVKKSLAALLLVLVNYFCSRFNRCILCLTLPYPLVKAFARAFLLGESFLSVADV